MSKVVIIGATSGIGRELARLFVKNGDSVGITGRRQDLLTDLQQEFPLQIVTECFDVMGQENISHLESLIKKLKGLDLLIYNSGYGEVSKTLSWEIDRQTTLTNVLGFAEIVNYAFNYFVQQGWGHIAATSSIASLVGNSHAPAYSASKAYMSTYMAGLKLKTLRLKNTNAALDLSITDIQPGFVATKSVKEKGRFWEAPVEKAAAQIFIAIRKKKRRAYVTHRWSVIARILKWMPYFIVKKWG